MPDIFNTKIGKVTIFSDGSSLTFQDCDNPNFQITIPTSELWDILAFLRSMEPDKTESMEPNNTEKRLGFRVPIFLSMGLSASVTFGDKTCSVDPLDLSLSGILVEFSKGEVYELPIDAQIKIRLQLHNTTAVIHGVVYRRSGNIYGIFFRDSSRNHDLDPPDSLKVIFGNLERQWLRKRLKI